MCDCHVFITKTQLPQDGDDRTEVRLNDLSVKCSVYAY